MLGRCDGTGNVFKFEVNGYMERFQLTLRLASPVITGGGYMTLDALLAAVLF
jgi:hypothetical protein